MASRFNRVKVTTSTSADSASPLILGSAVSGFADASSYSGYAGIPYIAMWGDGAYEIGSGALNESTLTRSVFENNLGTADAQAIPSGATVLFGVIAQAVFAVGDAQSDAPAARPSAPGDNSIAAGAAVAGGSFSLAIGTDLTLALGEGSTALNGGTVGNDGANSVAIGWCSANHPGQISLGRAPNEFIRIGLNTTTTNATATAVLPISALAEPLAVPAAEVWYIKARVIGTVFDGSDIPTKVIVRELSCIAQSTGMLGSLTASSPFNYGSSTATATMTISAAGVVTLTVTGIAATTVQWSVAVDIQRSTIA